MINKRFNNRFKRINENREITYNPFDLFFNKKIVNGQFVTVGYIKDASEESPKPFGQKNNIPENDDELRNYLNEYKNTLWAQDYARIIETPGYQAALNGSKKTAKFILEGNIVRIQRFTYQWRDPKNFGKAFDREAEEIMQARAKAGFGDSVKIDDIEPDEFYDEEDWRRKPKYMGTGIRQRGLKKKSSSGYRFATPAPGLYSYSGTDEEKYDKMAIRNMLDPRMNSNDPVAKKKSGYKSVYYYVAPDGIMEEMPNDFINFIRYNYKGERATKPSIQDEMSADEKEFNEIIDAIQKKYADKQQPTDLLFDQILYITATPIGWNEKANRSTKGTPMVFINNRVVYKTFPFLKARYLNPVISQFCTSVKSSDIEMVTEKRKVLKRKALYENMNNDKYVIYIINDENAEDAIYYENADELIGMDYDIEEFNSEIEANAFLRALYRGIDERSSAGFAALCSWEDFDQPFIDALLSE